MFICIRRLTFGVSINKKMEYPGNSYLQQDLKNVSSDSSLWFINYGPSNLKWRMLSALRKSILYPSFFNIT